MFNIKLLAVCTAVAATSLGGCMSTGGYAAGPAYEPAPTEVAACYGYGCGPTIPSPPRPYYGPGYGARPGYTAQPQRILLPNPAQSMPGAYRCTDPQTGQSGWCVPNG